MGHLRRRLAVRVREHWLAELGDRLKAAVGIAVGDFRRRRHRLQVGERELHGLAVARAVLVELDEEVPRRGLRTVRGRARPRVRARVGAVQRWSDAKSRPDRTRRTRSRGCGRTRR